MLIMAAVRIAAAGILGVIAGKATKADHGDQLFALVAMGSALMAVVSTEFFHFFILPGNVDPGRLAAQVISALGFIGSGLIWLENKQVRGTRTAASLWLTAIMGLLIGAGLTTVTAGALIFTMLVLLLGNLIDVDKLLGPKTENIYVDESDEE